MRLLGHPGRAGETAGVSGNINRAFEAWHLAVLVCLNQAAFAEWERTVGSPVRAGHAGHEQGQVAGDFSAFGDDLVRFEAFDFVAQVGFDAALVHFLQDFFHGFFAQAFARLGAGGKKDQLEAVAPTLFAQQGVGAKQQFEHRPAAHGRRFLGVAAKAKGNGAT